MNGRVLYLLLYITGAQIFQKSSSPQNSRRQTGDMKQIAYRGPTNVGCHHSKFSRLGDLTPGIYVPTLYITVLLHPS